MAPQITPGLGDCLTWMQLVSRISEYACETWTDPWRSTGDILGMTVLGDRMTDPTEGGRLHNYLHRRQARRWVSLAYGDGATPTLTLTSHPGDDPDGEPIKLDMVGISHISFGVANVKALTEELISKGVALAGPIESFTGPDGDIRSIYVYDPDGILVQFNTP